MTAPKRYSGGGVRGPTAKVWYSEVEALRAERDALQARVERAEVERDNLLAAYESEVRDIAGYAETITQLNALGATLTAERDVLKARVEELEKELAALRDCGKLFAEAVLRSDREKQTDDPVQW